MSFSFNTHDYEPYPINSCRGKMSVDEIKLKLLKLSHEFRKMNTRDQYTVLTELCYFCPHEMVPDTNICHHCKLTQSQIDHIFFEYETQLQYGFFGTKYDR